MSQYNDLWEQLRASTSARLGLGRTGGSLPTAASLRFRIDHAKARDAVWAPANWFDLEQQAPALQIDTIRLSTMASSRDDYLRFPDKGRRLSEAAAQKLGNTSMHGADIALIAADGLSALALQHNLMPMLTLLLPALRQEGLSHSPLMLVSQGRVAIGDDIGERTQCKLSVVFIGERPGLSASDSMGIYLTYGPVKGTTDERRNCISNIRPEGLSYLSALNKLMWLIRSAMHTGYSGYLLKEDAPVALVSKDPEKSLSR